MHADGGAVIEAKDEAAEVLFRIWGEIAAQSSSMVEVAAVVTRSTGATMGKFFIIQILS